MIYLDNAATSFYKPSCVEKAVVQAMRECASPSRGAYGAALQADRILFELRSELARLFHASAPECAALTMNATHALNTAIFGIGLKKGDHLLVSEMEHNSVLRPAWALQRQGIQVHVIGLDEAGTADCNEMERVLMAIPKGVLRAVACTHASNLTGAVNDIGKIGKLCEKYEAVFILDAAQTAGLLPIDMKKDKVDVLCFSGHKALEGPQGTGAIIVNREMALKPLMEGGSGVQTFLDHMPQEMPARLEAGTQNVPAAAGLLAALCFEKNHRDENYRKAMRCRDRFLKDIEDLSVHFEKIEETDIRPIILYGAADTAPHLPTAAFNIAGEDAARVADYLWEHEQIAVRAGGHCAPLMHKHFGTENGGSVRISFSHRNTDEEVKRLIEVLRKITKSA